MALEALYEFCNQTNRKRRPRRESPDFKVVDKVMEWWLGDEWRNSTVDQQEKHLRSATQWANQRVKRTRHRLVDENVLQSRLGLLLQMASNGATGNTGQSNGPRGMMGERDGAAQLPQFRGSARDWAAQLGLGPHQYFAGPRFVGGPPGMVPGMMPPGMQPGMPPCPHTAHSLACGHPPVKVRSHQGETSLGFVVNRASCCAASGNLLCDVHAGHAGPGHPRPLEYSTVSHGDHIDFVIDGHLTHPTSERTEDGQLLWEDCGELLELDEDTINDMYNILV